MNEFVLSVLMKPYINWTIVGTLNKTIYCNLNRMLYIFLEPNANKLR